MTHHAADKIFDEYWSDSDLNLEDVLTPPGSQVDRRQQPSRWPAGRVRCRSVSGTRRDRTTTIVRIMTTSRPRRPERSTWQLWSPAIVGVLVLASSLLGFASDERLRLWFALLGAAGFVLAVIAIVRAITYRRGVR